MKIFVPLVLSVACIASAPAMANQITFGGDTGDGPGFERPGPGVIGSAYRYLSYAFTVSQAGIYTFTSTAMDFDNLTALYLGDATVVDAAHLLIYNDDSTDARHSGFDYSLAANTTYNFVTTAYSLGQSGVVSNSITGAGTISPFVSAVPEPETVAMLLAGMGTMWMKLRRRQKQQCQ
ncbi:PEP-CTERM sorting domain-containing protein [Xylophilus rhododendri]|uniref:PEP-CTERM sorting domain-containing protein n=1 Tax=Xylophilus rhododendri TaxID=2697032 RepID=A0A857J7I6_9BURK|nr:FxDxF family PEP-CTERM protein [Xylophilus rhododendri]QHI99039.1 PEP-CTERM sorting domain-containing protein [Xylophilus rhododendri]